MYVQVPPAASVALDIASKVLTTWKVAMLILVFFSSFLKIIKSGSSLLKGEVFFGDFIVGIFHFWSIRNDIVQSIVIYCIPG